MNTQTPSPVIGDDMQAALALRNEARRRSQEQFLPAPAGQPDNRHLLIEGTMTGLFLDVTMPNGEVWHYRPQTDIADGRTLLLCIDTAIPEIALIFTPTAEGLHPFVGHGNRFGVERKAA